jgi:hypothetical protein
MSAARHCLVCGAEGTKSLGIRARHENTNAVWAPNLDAWLCDLHATSGCVITIGIEPTMDGRVRTRTFGPRGAVAATVLVIGTGGKTEPADQESLPL